MRSGKQTVIDGDGYWRFRLPVDVMAEIVERTDGIPLFVVKMTKALLEAENEDAPARRPPERVIGGDDGRL
jgi:hypothetical protein